MHDDMPFDDPIDLSINDGFGNDEDAPDAEYVVWQGETNAHSACIHFLHGALHLFDSGKELLKYTWVRKGVPLIEQARSALHNGAFPLFVAEGTSGQKKRRFVITPIFIRVLSSSLRMFSKAPVSEGIDAAIDR